MSRAPAVAVQLAVGALVALAALALVHHELVVPVAVGVAVLAVAAATVMRQAWSTLPAFVGRWLELGVVVVAALIASGAHGLSRGLPYAVLRAPELAGLGGAAALLGVALAGLGYTLSRLVREVEAQERRVAELERAALHSRLTALTAQIHPHFLFNTLNTLAEVVHEDEDLAEDLITDLSAMMRYALRSSVQRVPLEEELDVVRRLLHIEEARLGERLTWSIEGEAPGATLPGLLVQPLVENAVQHGVATRAEGGAVRVRIGTHGDRLWVEVHDDGPGLPADVAAELAGAEPEVERGTAGAGGGLRNTAERLRLSWPDGDASLTHDTTRDGTCLILDMPLETAR